MTDTSNVADANLEGADGNQTPVSPEKDKSIAGAPPNSQEFLELRKVLDLTRSELKGLQSRQDKEKNETQRFMEEVKAHVAKGLSLDEAEKAVNIDREAKLKDDLLYKMAEKMGVLGNSPQNVTGNDSNAADEAAKVFAKYGVSPNDPEAVSLLNLQGVDLVDGVASLALRKAKQSPLDPSEAGSISSGAPSAPIDESKLISKLQQLQKEPTKNVAEIAKLKKELKW